MGVAHGLFGKYSIMREEYEKALIKAQLALSLDRMALMPLLPCPVAELSA